MSTLTNEQKEELEKIGELYRSTIYSPSTKGLYTILKSFIEGLKNIDGDISESILCEVVRFYRLIKSKYFFSIREMIDGLREVLSENFPDVYFQIKCRQKSWESVIRKILKSYLEGESIILYDLVALRIIIDSNKFSEKELEEICHKISDICIKYFSKKMCRLMPPTKIVGGNSLIKDYINYPKENGYKSIHLAFMDEDNNIFEVQIRTQEEDINAEYGPENQDKTQTTNLDHVRYKDDEYSLINPYIYFEANKVSKPFFRSYKRNGVEIITDKIGLKYAKPIEERCRIH